MERTTFKSFDGTPLSCCVWDKVLNPKGVIQLIHGMASHAARYDAFANRLNECGYIAYADDHRAHGYTAGANALGIAAKDNFIASVKDEIYITRMLKEKYNLPVQLFAHSYGSFLAQRYLELESDQLSGVILSGSAYMGGKKIKFARALTSIISLLGHPEKPDRLMYKLANKHNDTPFLDDGIKNAWLNRNLESVKSYNEDPFCGKIMSKAFYYSFMHGLPVIYSDENLMRIDKKLPIYIVSGMKDVVGGMGVKVIKLYHTFIKYDLNVTLSLFEDARHELLSDPDKDEIIAEIVEFYDSNILPLSSTDSGM